MVHGCTKYVRKGNDVQIHTGKPAVPTATPNRQPFAWPKLLTENGRPLSNALVLTTDATNDDPVLMRLTSEKAHKIVNTNSHDLMLSAQLFKS